MNEITNSPPSRTRLTFDLPNTLLDALSVRAVSEERTLAGQVRHFLNLGLGLTDEPEIARDTTLPLPGMQ